MRSEARTALLDGFARAELSEHSLTSQALIAGRASPVPASRFSTGVNTDTASLRRATQQMASHARVLKIVIDPGCTPSRCYRRIVATSLSNLMICRRCCGK